MQFSFQTVQFSPQFGADVSLADVLAGASSGGFKSVGLDVWSVAGYAERGQSLAELTAMLEQLGLRCTDVLPLVVGDDGDAVMESAARLATLATATGASVCAAAIGPEVTDPHDRRVRDGLRRGAEVLDRAGVRMAIEYLPYSCVASVADAVELCDAVGWNAGLLVDSWHTFVTGQVAALGVVSARDIAMVQFSDGVIPQLVDVREASRNHRRLPGRGEFDLAAFVDAVVATGYAGIVSPEVLSAEVRVATPASFAVDLHRSLHAHWGTAGARSADTVVPDRVVDPTPPRPDRRATGCLRKTEAASYASSAFTERNQGRDRQTSARDTRRSPCARCRPSGGSGVRFRTARLASDVGGVPVASIELRTSGPNDDEAPPPAAP